MKRLLLSVLVMLSVYIAGAAPAYPFPITVTQPDGTQLTIRLHGDEHFHWTTTMDGVLLVNTNNGYYIADIDNNGELKATSLLAHETTMRQPNELTVIERQTVRRAAYLEQGAARAEAARRAPAIQNSVNYFPHSGSPRALIILAAYGDCPFTISDPKKSFEQFFNGSGSPENFGNNEDRNLCSVNEYFRTCSNGLFSPQFDIVGPVTLPENMSAYGGTQAGPGGDNFNLLCKDALNLIKDDVDLSLYDNDGDGKVELIYILHAGLGENTGGAAETMWAKCGQINMTVGDITVVRGGCHSELFRGTSINGIGNFCHEFSHGMGLPDLYVTTTGQAREALNQTMVTWDLMDYGMYNNNANISGSTPGFGPCAYTAWEQEVMGWINIEELNEPLTSMSLKPLLDGGKAYKIQNPDKPNEYIVLENIQQRGLNVGSYGHGLLAYHVDYTSGTINVTDNPNNTYGHPRLALIPAGGINIPSNLVSSKNQPNAPYTQAQWTESQEGVPFPGKKDIIALTDEMDLPNFCFYSGTSSTKVEVKHSLYNITEDDATGTVTFSYDYVTTPVTDEALEIDFSNGTTLTEDTPLANSLTGKIYYNLSGDDGYNATEQCIVVNTNSDMDNPTDIATQLAGLMLTVIDEGTISITCQTTGNAILNVRVGEEVHQYTELSPEEPVNIPFNVSEPTQVYIYKTETAAAPALTATIGENALKLYALKVLPGATGILSTLGMAPQGSDKYYTLDGRCIDRPVKGGIYIYRGRKVIY